MALSSFLPFVPIITIRKGCANGSNTQVSFTDFNKIDSTTIYCMDWSSNTCHYLPLTCLNFPNLQQFYCVHNLLELIPDIIFPNLKIFNCSFNQLTILPDNIVNCTNLIELTCFNNKLQVLPNLSFENLQILSCYCNKLTTLPTEMYLPELLELNCYANKLQSLPNNMNFPNLKNFDCANNQLKSLPNNMNFPNLERFNCSNNQLESLSACILNFCNLQTFCYANNRIELSVQFARFIDRINNRESNLINVYNDGQNVHNSTIQLTVRESINQITLRTDVPKYNIEQLFDLIIKIESLTEKTKLLLFEYCNDLSVHSLLLLTFSEVLWFIFQTIITDFEMKEQEEIFNILNQEIKDTECKCFSGRMCRVINCLNGFSHLVNININDGEQIGNIIVLVKNKLESSDNYTIEKHKSEVQNELLERGYDIETINLWLEHIE